MSEWVREKFQRSSFPFSFRASLNSLLLESLSSTHVSPKNGGQDASQAGVIALRSNWRNSSGNNAEDMSASHFKRFAEKCSF